MATVLVVQRNAHLATSVRLEVVNGREGKPSAFTAPTNTQPKPS